MINNIPEKHGYYITGFADGSFNVFVLEQII